MQVLLIEPYYGGSHRAWADGYKNHSAHDVILLTLPAQFWKWRMQGGAISLSRMIQEQQIQPDIILASGMMNVATFKALTAEYLGNIPIATYFHETQLTYPQNRRQRHGWRYGFINYVSMLASDWSFFNSLYHRNIFLKTAPNMLKHFGDYNELSSIDHVRQTSSVLPLGLDLSRFDVFKPTQPPSQTKTPLIIWNHRWEADKNPSVFFKTLYKLADDGIAFEVAITGENFRQVPEEFEQARKMLGKRVVQFGYLPSFDDYAQLLWEADYVISTSYQDFFGGSIAEAIYCQCTPLLPKRVNYPNLIPADAQDTCLFKGNSLHPKLEHHLTNELKVDTQRLREYVSQFDWQILAPHYDAELERLLR